MSIKLILPLMGFALTNIFINIWVASYSNPPANAENFPVNFKVLTSIMTNKIIPGYKCQRSLILSDCDLTYLQKA